MTTRPKEEVKIEDYQREPLTVGEPDVSGPIAVYPVFGPAPVQHYTSMSRAQALGFKVNEQPGGGSVRDVLVTNPTDSAVLIYEGEEVIGGQQNRTFDKSLLIAPGETLIAPVSCVEQGRWDGSRNSEDFQSSQQAADPDMRRRKASSSHRARVSGMEERADQGEVWDAVARSLVQPRCAFADRCLQRCFRKPPRPSAGERLGDQPARRAGRNGLPGRRQGARHSTWSVGRRSSPTSTRRWSRVTASTRSVEHPGDG